MPYAEWLAGLDASTAGRVGAHADRMKTGSFGRSRFVGRGVFELKIDFGPGYRVYYLRDGQTVVVLLCGGDKGSQHADIRLAHRHAADYWSRK